MSETQTIDEVTAYMETRGGELPAKQPELPLDEGKPKEEAKAEEQPKANGAADETDKEPKTVPLWRFQQEVNKKKTEREEKSKLAERLARAEGELSVLKQPKQEPAKQPEKPADWNEDPRKAHQELADKVEKIAQGTADQQKQQQYQQAHQRFMSDYRTKVQAFTGDKKDFPDAYNFLAESRIKEYQAAGYSAEDAQALTWRDEERLALDMMTKGKNPAEVMYQIAETRGYKARAAEPEKKGNGEKTVEAVERGRKVDTSIGGAQGGAPAGPLTLEAVVGLPDDEFAAMMTDEKKRAKFWSRNGG